MEKLYNGIVLPDEWPPEKRPFHVEGEKLFPNLPPYLVNPPEVIDVTLGRQLFVDDFLLESSEVPFEYHKAEKYEGNPIFQAETEFEHGPDGLPCACPKSGGIVFDPSDGKYKMWYEAGWLNATAYAESTDGVHWSRPELDVVPGTNLILPVGERKGLAANGAYFRPDSNTVIMDLEDEPSRKFKMMMRNPGAGMPALFMTSPDGIHWSEPAFSGDTYDRSTFFYNPFRRKWCFSIRNGWSEWQEYGLKTNAYIFRTRGYFESSDFMKAGSFKSMDQYKWLNADSMDAVDPDPDCCGYVPELYNVDAVAYESIMLGMFQIFRGPENEESAKQRHPKYTDLIPMYSRDGYHWSRPCRESLIASARKPGTWDRGYVQSVGGIGRIEGDRFIIYYIGFSGEGENLPENRAGECMYAGGALGMASIRRDGFVSLSGTGCVTTRVLTFTQGRDLFVNVKGTLSAELLGADGTVLAVSEPIRTDSTAAKLDFGTYSPETLAKQKFRIRFHLENAELYAFWFSKDSSGKSGGFLPGHP